MKQFGLFAVGALGIGLAIFLSVKSSPSMTSVPGLPHLIANWANRHGRLCNFPAYALLAVPILLCARRGWQRAGAAAGLAALIAGLELVQLWIPTRVADRWDVFWGCAGVLASWVGIELAQFVLGKIKFSNRRKP